MDGKPAGFGGKEACVNLEDPYHVMLLPSVTDTIDLTEGKHDVELQLEGDPKVPVGLDFVWLQQRR